MRMRKAVVVLAFALVAVPAAAAPAAHNGALAVGSNFAGARSGHTGLYRVDADGSNARQLTRDRPDLEPAWSPSGRSIAFARSLANGTTQIWVMRGDGSGRRRLARRGAGWPTWSPNGTRS